MGGTRTTFHQFRSGDRTVRVETFPGRTERPRPGVMLLHGANGIRFANPVVSGVMQYLGAHDFVVHLVHYFDRTSTSYADDRTIRENFSAWLETVGEAVQHIQEYGKGSPLGLFGHSLGGYLTAATLIRNPAVCAAVVLSGGLDEESARAVRRTAPTLILHGAEDTRVPLAEARRLEAVLAAAGAPPEFHVYEGEGHILEMGSYADALDRATRFLRERLA
jgi:dipeptidyl aminopeptidase/acylaminoacyl peptidase